jgi:hypothetical protein
MRQYAREAYGLISQPGWTRDSEAYLLMLRVAVDIQLSVHETTTLEQSGELLREVLREWVLQTKGVGAVPPLSATPAEKRCCLVATTVGGRSLLSFI